MVPSLSASGISNLAISSRPFWTYRRNHVMMSTMPTRRKSTLLVVTVFLREALVNAPECHKMIRTGPSNSRNALTTTTVWRTANRITRLNAALGTIVAPAGAKGENTWTLGAPFDIPPATARYRGSVARELIKPTKARCSKRRSFHGSYISTRNIGRIENIGMKEKWGDHIWKEKPWGPYRWNWSRIRSSRATKYSRRGLTALLT